ncbi:PAS domain S-box protein [Bradyrhizobium sp. CCGUVB23]|uniref:PAS domain-containing sensor histidine kinase n=1 Tax=Bradyrhizobium sp. CCGUVB23 TaxID=2949630 RepID=UPI0020B210A7|nr:PAS domain S-box protein [Bradyrhizobium sp. CCGUVB23]MCP3459406.1 PAS domain S-box protein [Bradyrhizobium sp. CCGUVB23]
MQHPVQVPSAAVDLNERKHPEEALRESEERFRTLVQFSFDVYWETDAHHRFIRQEFAETLSQPPVAEIGRTRWEVSYLEPDAEGWRKHRKTLDAHLPFRDFEHARPTPDGGKRYTSVSGLPVFDETGRFMGYRGVGRYITERKRAEQALRESEARYRTFVDHATDTFMLHDEDGRVLDVNRNACESLGYSRDELIGAVPFFFNLDMDEASWRVNRERLKAGGIATLESRYRRTDGTVFPVEVRMREFCEGGQRQIICLSRDITERKRAAETFREMQAELTHANRAAAMGQVTASVTHELSQPITAMLCNAEAALNWLGSQAPNLEKARRALASIVADAKRGGEIIGWIRSLIKKTPAPKGSLDVNGVILDVITIVRSELIKHGVLLQTDLAPGLPLVEGYRVQLQQVVLNLILNAIEAMNGHEQGGRELRISTAADASNVVVVTVRDNGPGLDAAMVDRLFEPFYTTKPEGIGMGLSICHSIIEAHGGGLWAGANEPRGAVFQFNLPAGQGDPRRMS